MNFPAQPAQEGAGRRRGISLAVWVLGRFVIPMIPGFQTSSPSLASINE
jgi:hypothetical protein